MILLVVYILVPLVLYAALAALPRGRAAWTGIGIAAVLLAGLWLTRTLALSPLVSGDAVRDGYMTATLIFWSGATALAALAQALRAVLRLHGWGYGGLATALLVLAAAPTLGMLGL